MELAKGIIIPVVADFVLSPDVLYSEELTGIYFQTGDGQFGRITFENLDALKISRGENLPFTENWEEGQEYPWVYKIENSKWLKERFDYENENYGRSYEFGSNVNEMLTDFSHFVFKFHDQFLEVIERGFWFEKDKTSLFKRELQVGHPFLNLPDTNTEKFVSHNLTCQVRTNSSPLNKLVSDAKFCSQKLIEFALELDGIASVDNSLILSYRNGKLISILKGFFGKQILEFDGIAKLTDAKPYIEKYIGEVYERRKSIAK
ncbi:hypothetical protein [Aquiflexum gelatinilyticum]|uniref:Uncharacterized protein n=1 Tax=Aquiflexum gelatinilyticum TaxID=2961943 RepID=A0A9X2P851_9BACT|nr:hypothetical protein [Aquiflexum gelatinilyticum]MCR9016018.1 hypothetical protein [Aquiflexum gelatinilyticum]